MVSVNLMLTVQQIVISIPTVDAVHAILDILFKEPSVFLKLLVSKTVILKMDFAIVMMVMF
jgi:hypothetical protein